MFTIKDNTLDIDAAKLREVQNLFSGYGEGEIILHGEPGFISASADGITEGAEIIEGSVTKTAKLAVYKLLRKITGVSFEWGAMTGVKPLKKYLQLVAQGCSKAEISRFFTECYAVSPQKLALLEEIACVQAPYLKNDKKKIGFYAHIPLCPSKCRYCSFPSRVTSAGSDECETYLDALLYEAQMTLPFLREQCFTVDSAYFGGGTPSILSESQIEKIFLGLSDYLKNASEITFEAGRADTLSSRKLKLLKELNVSRISVNAQTTNDESLSRIGRNIKNDEFLRAFEQARSLGFAHINCDLILGLSGETEADYERSIKAILALAPENITLHTLCAKRTAELAGSELKSTVNIARYQNLAHDMLAEYGYAPYYVYKQKNALDGGENIGYARLGSVCVYNIRMMGESANILAIGAGSSSKLVRAEGFGYRDVLMPKDYTHYVSNVESLCEKKLARLCSAAELMGYSE